jgi:hypothetical protein
MSSPFLASSTSFIRPAVTAFGKAPFRSRLLQALVRVRSAARAKWFTVQTQNDRDHELAIVRIPRVTRILRALRIRHDVRRGRLAANSISYRHIYLRRRLSAQTDEAVFSRGTLALGPSDRRCASLSALTELRRPSLQAAIRSVARLLHGWQVARSARLRSAPFADRFPENPKDLLAGAVPANGWVKPRVKPGHGKNPLQFVSKNRNLCYKILFDGLTRGQGSVRQGEACTGYDI